MNAGVHLSQKWTLPVHAVGQDCGGCVVRASRIVGGPLLFFFCTFPKVGLLFFFCGLLFSYFLRISKDRKRQQKAAKDSKRQEKEQERTRERKSRGPMGRPVAGVGRPVAAVGGP